MKFRLEGLATMAFACLAGLTLAGPSAAQNQGKGMPSPPKGATAGEFFKNVTTSTLKGLSPSDFLGAMGVMNAALGYDCSNCHPGAGTDNFDWVTDRVPQKQTARKMVEMVAAINKQNFGNAQMVTCWTCHHGSEVPTTSIALDKLYGAPPDERSDIVPAGQGVPTAMKVLDDYIAAMGGATKLAGLKSYVVSGHSDGYGGLGGSGKFEIYAQSPDKRGMWISFPEHPDRGISSWTYNGTTGWISQPRALLGEYELTGNDLAGAKLDAAVAFPGQIKNAFTTWRIGPEDSLNGHDVYIVQGSARGGLLGTFYFDKNTHLLMRYVRQTPSPVGRVTIQQDYDDYRDVDGIKFPFKYSFLWLDGRFTATINDVKVNTPIEAAKFTKP